MTTEIGAVERQRERFGLGKPIVKFSSYDDPHSLNIATKIRELTREVDGWAEPQLEEASKLLRTFGAHARAIVQEEEQAVEYFQSLAGELAGLVSSLSGMVPASFVAESLTLAKSGPEWALKSLGVRMKVLLDQLGENAGTVLIIGETPNLRRRLAEWIDSRNDSQMPKLFSVRKNFLELENSGEPPFDRCFILAAPSRIIRSTDFHPRRLRLLIGGGVAKETSFLFPNWIYDIGDEEFEGELFSGLPVTKGLTFMRLSVGEKIAPEALNLPGESAFRPDLFEIEEIAGKDFEVTQLSRGGSVSCVLISCADGLVFPIEASATSLSAITYQGILSGDLHIKDSPLTSLQAGDIVMARLDSSERESLRRNTILRLGDLGKSFDLHQTRWKNELLLKSQEVGWQGINRALVDSGISVAPRAETWADALSLGPAANRDFLKLLRYLNWSESEALTTIGLAREVWNELIHEGHIIRTAVLEHISDEMESALLAGKTVFIKIEEHGDAQYALAPVASTDFEVMECDPSQVRRLVRRG
jgi:hypothetical protein